MILRLLFVCCFLARHATTANTQQSWSSFLTFHSGMIPSPVYSTFRHLLPEAIQNNTDLLSQLCSIDSIQVNVLSKYLVLEHCNLGLRNHPALRIGRLYLKWDQWSQPAVDIHVHDVELNLEFNKVLLGMDCNWWELRRGLASIQSTYVTTQETLEDNDVLLFQNMGVSGNVTVRLASRPMKRDIAVVHAKLDRVWEIPRLRHVSEENLVLFGRRGCSLSEIGTLLRDTLIENMQTLVPKTWSFVRNDPKRTTEIVERVFETSVGSIVGYANGATRLTRSHLEKTVLQPGRQAIQRPLVWGLSKVDRSHSQLQSVVSRLTRRRANQTKTCCYESISGLLFPNLVF